MIKNKVLKTIFIVSMIVAIGFPLISIYYIYPSFTKLLIKNVEKDAINAGNYVSGVLMKHRESFNNKILPDDFYVEISKIVETFELMKLKIFMPSGEVIYSTDDKDIGIINDKPYFREIVAKGKPYSKIVNKGSKSKEGELLSLDVIEIYVPNMIAGKFDGAYEFYYDITALSKEINQVVLWSSIIPLIVMFIFLVVIVAIIVRANTSKLESQIPEKTLRYKSPYYSMAMAAISIVIAEIIAMHIVHSFEGLSEIQESITDSIILIMLVAPSVYFFFVQPLMKYIDDLRATRDELINEIEIREYSDQMHHDSEERFRSVAESANDAIIYTDVHGEVIFWNKAAENIFGYSADEIVGKSVAPIIPERLREAHKKDIEQIQNEGELKIIEKTIEFIGLKKNGSEFPVEMSIATWKTGNETYFTAIIRDIIERKKAEENLNQLRHHQELILSTAGEGIYGLDINGNTTFINPAAAKMIGWDSEKLIGKSQHDVLHHTKPDGTAYPREECPIYAAFKDGAVHEINNEVFWRKDGSSFPVEYISTPMRDTNDRLIGAVVSFRDISERKQAEEIIKNQVSRLSALRSIDKAIISSLDLDLTLDIFLSHVQSELHIDAASVLLLNKDSQMLKYAVSKGFRTNALKYTQLRMGESYAGRAAIERTVINIPDLKKESLGFVRSHLFSEEDFISYFAVPLVAKGEVLGVLEIYHRNEMSVDAEWVEFLEAIADQGAIALDNSFLFTRLQSSNIELALAYDRTLEGWSRALDLRDKETEGHSQRVTELTIRIAQEFQVKGEELAHIRRGALLHDIGKMGIPDSILLKPGKLTEEEWRIMKLHPVYARDLIYPIEYLRPVIDVPYYHHERWDGKGYPEGLKGEKIPLSARIFAVVDVWDALNSDRPYRSAWPREKVINHIRSLVGTHFDAGVIEVFLSMAGIKERDMALF